MYLLPLVEESPLPRLTEHKELGMDNLAQGVRRPAVVQTHQPLDPGQVILTANYTHRHLNLCTSIWKRATQPSCRAPQDLEALGF